ncbi:MAG: GMC family oxidoreductase N-terminal domain-containing protein [Dehalococcoidia bacterium]
MVLSRRQLLTLERFADALLPRGGPLSPGASDVGTAAAVVERVARLPWRFRLLVALALTAWEYSAVLRHGRPFSTLALDIRQRWLQSALEGRFFPLRLIAFWLRAFCVFAFCADRRVEEAIGFTRSCIDASPPRDGPRLQPIAYPAIGGNVVETVDAVVIGSGAGGAVVAKELAEAGLSVVVIEEGAYFAREDYADGTPWERVWKLYRDGGLTGALGSPVIPIPLGKAVGGTTVVNSGTCFRPPDRVLGEWERRWGIEGIDAATLEPIFRRVEETISVQPAPWEIIGKNAEVFHRGVKALGYHGQPIRRNIDGCRGCGVCVFGCPSDAKRAMHLSYLPRAAAHGAKIYARCRARRLLVEGGRAVGVEADILDASSDEIRGRLRVRAAVVVVAAGAIHTPALLMANGLALDSGQVGRNLRIHPSLAVSAAFEEEVYSWRGTLQSYYVDDLEESHGVLLEVTSLLPGLSAASAREVGPKLKEVLARSRYLASVGLFVSDSSKGRILRGLGRDWWTSPPIIYSLGQDDTDRLLRGVALAAEVFLAAGAVAVFTGIRGLAPVTNRQDVRSLQKLSLRPERLSPVGFHPMGTCRMGRDAAVSAVAPYGEAHAVRNLFVADASVFPSCIGVNPQLTIMAFATRTAFHIVKRGA